MELTDGSFILMQLVFLVLTGETWGYLGSRRFLLELDLQSDAVSGLTNSLFEMVYFSALANAESLMSNDVLSSIDRLTYSMPFMIHLLRLL